MYFKCILENGTEVYKKIDESVISQFVDPNELNDLVYRKTGNQIYQNDWVFTEFSENYGNVATVDFKEILDLDNILDFLEEEEPVKIKEVKFLEDNSYEHLIASLSLDSPEDVYKKKILFTIDDGVGDNPYSDDPNDYYDAYSDDPS